MGGTTWVLGGLFAWVAVAQEGERGTLLARIPAEITVPGYVYERTGPRCMGQRGGLAWSADGRTVAYAGLRGGLYVPVVGAEMGESYDFVGPPSAAGEHVFFNVARRKSAEREQHWLWIDGQTIGPEDWMGDHVVRPDGKQVLVWTNPGARFGPNATASKKHKLLKATEKGSQWALTRGDDWLEIGPIRFGGQDACAAALDRGKGWTVFRAEKREPRLCEPCDGIESFALAPGGAFAYVRTRADAGRAFPSAADEPQLFFEQKRVGKKHEVVSTATLDAAGAHVAYVVVRDGKRTVAAGEEAAPRGQYDHVLEIAFAPSGARLAFVALRGGTFSAETPGLLQGGRWHAVERALEPGAEPGESPGFLEVRDLRWDASGRRLAYAARDAAGWRVVSGETQSAPHTDVGPPVFSADGSTLGFGSRDGDELWWRQLELR